MSVDDTPLTHPPLERPPLERRAGAAGDELEARARRAAMDALAHAAAGAGDHPRARAALAAAVELVEAASASGLGTTTADAAVVLQRRLARALRGLDRFGRLEEKAGGHHGGGLTVAALLLAAERLEGASDTTRSSRASGTGR